MKKRGFTLVELMAVLAVIALLAVIIFPVITNNIKDAKEDTRAMQMASIKEAAIQYVADNVGVDSFLESNNEIIPLQTLIENGYLNGEYKDPLYGNEYDLNQSKVIVTKNNNSYEYEVELVIK